MLQTEEYAHALLNETEANPQQAQRYVEFRMARQRALTGDTPVACRAVTRFGCGCSEVISRFRPGVRSCAGRGGGRGVRVLCGCGRSSTAGRRRR
uniref:Scr1 family TA system antitoxin-like transcriptional regulator n=1 Tax=Streptomyces umbrinus TaxID=67370 RepID=UPI003F4CCD08